MGIPRAKLHQNAMWGDNPPEKKKKKNKKRSKNDDDDGEGKRRRDSPSQPRALIESDP